MEHISIWNEKFKITHSFVNPDGLASIQGIAYCLQETAVNHASARKLGYEDLIIDNKAWVLTRQHIKLYEIPRLSMNIIIESWVDSSTDIISIRDFHIYNQNSDLLGLARTSWMLLDLTSRKPVRIKKDILDRIPHTPGKLKENIALEKIPPMEESNGQASIFKVEYSDLDMNHHVNNINYLKWVLNDFDFKFRKKFRLESIEINFIREAIYADRLSRETIKNQQNNHEYITKMVNSDTRKAIINSRTKWVPKD